MEKETSPSLLLSLTENRKSYKQRTRVDRLVQLGEKKNNTARSLEEERKGWKPWPGFKPRRKQRDDDTRQSALPMDKKHYTCTVPVSEHYGSSSDKRSGDSLNESEAIEKKIVESQPSADDLSGFGAQSRPLTQETQTQCERSGTIGHTQLGPNLALAKKRQRTGTDTKRSTGGSSIATSLDFR